MAEKKCPHCATMIPAEAKVCPNCRKKLGRSWIFLVLLGIASLYVIGKIAGTGTLPPTSSVTSTSSGASSSTPLLELQSWHWGESYSHAIGEGTVKNISDRKLENVTAVVQFYDKNGDLITADEALIDYNPILPNQISPFKVIATYNPAMMKAGIDFKFLMGGTIEFTEKHRGKKK